MIKSIPLIAIILLLQNERALAKSDFFKLIKDKFNFSKKEVSDSQLLSKIESVTTLEPFVLADEPTKKWIDTISDECKP